MKLFFDECLGTGVPKALRLVRFTNVLYLKSVYRWKIEQGRVISDDEWIARAGRQGWLVVTEDLAILDSSSERSLLVEHQVGIVFLEAAKLKSRDVLAFTLRRMNWFEEIDSEQRPFAYVTTLRGRPRRVELKSETDS